MSADVTGRPPARRGLAHGLTTRRRAAAALAVAVLAVPALAACSDDSSGPKAAPSPTVTIGTVPAAVPNPPADDSVEAGFSRDMKVHHAQAVEMSMIVRDLTQDEAVRRLAYDIAITQQEQIGRMSGWLQLWGLTPTTVRPPMEWMSPNAMPGHDHGQAAASPGADVPVMPGMATRAQMQQLAGLHGRDAEVMFLQLMIVHHESGVAMARDAQQRAQVEVVRDLARTMVEGQSSEIALMRDMLKERGAA